MLRYAFVVLLMAGHSMSALSQSAPNKQAELGELYYQLQLMQQDLMQLRGLVEEQGNQLRKLQQQRLDDYINLDRRIGELSAQPPVAGKPSASLPAAPTSAAAPAAAASPVAGLSETEAYQKAFSQVKARQFVEAAQSFQGFLKAYPNGEMAPNAWYWLGELYLQDGQLDQAIKHFQKVVDAYPSHVKVADATFKLGRAYRLKGDVAKSKALLNQVISQHAGSNAAQLAQTELNTQF
ncbi:MAG: tol-pal system protein YbgF [Gammaproteobacteria bacterium]|nr:MAG: tol-pal system protein YbgF [Gammaproteobacteria bacterium]